MNILDIVSALCLSTAASLSIITALFPPSPLIVVSVAIVVFTLTLIGSISQTLKNPDGPSYEEGFRDGKEAVLTQIKQDDQNDIKPIRSPPSVEMDEDDSSDYLKGFLEGYTSISNMFKYNWENIDDDIENEDNREEDEKSSIEEYG